MSKAILVIDMPSSCSKCKFMYEFYGVKKCQLLNILENGGKSIIPTETLTTDRKECCPLRKMPSKYAEKDFTPIKDERYDNGYEDGYNACIDESLKGEAELYEQRHREYPSTYHVYCKGYCVKQKDYKDADRAVKAWNIRRYSI